MDEDSEKPVPFRFWERQSTNKALDTFINALPLSGLVMNFGSGFVTSRKNPLVTGFNYNSFNLRNAGEVWAGAAASWQYGFGANVPAMGVIYTPTEIDRSDPSSSFLGTKSLPTDDGISQIFLTPQAEVPVTGNAWYIPAFSHGRDVFH